MDIIVKSMKVRNNIVINQKKIQIKLLKIVISKLI